MGRRRALFVSLLGALAALACLFLAALSAEEAKKDKAEETKDGWVALFDGKTLEGWEPTGGAEWEVTDGVLIGKQGKGNAPGDLWTRKTYGDFEAIVTFKVVWPANSGIWFRSDQPKALGYQVDILDMKEYGCTVGSIYSGGFLFQNKDESTVKLQDWNTVKLTAKGFRFQVELNAKKLADVTDEKQRYAKGKLGFQVHPGNQYKDMRIMVKECRVRELE